jgi:hypothetical protein
MRSTELPVLIAGNWPQLGSGLIFTPGGMVKISLPGSFTRRVYRLGPSGSMLTGDWYTFSAALLFRIPVPDISVTVASIIARIRLVLCTADRSN